MFSYSGDSGQFYIETVVAGSRDQLKVAPAASNLVNFCMEHHTI